MPKTTLEQAIRNAIEVEQAAELYYDALSDFTSGSTARFFKDIALQEAQHVTTVQKLIAANN
jgi:rubrerythrin